MVSGDASVPSQTSHGRPLNEPWVTSQRAMGDLSTGVARVTGVDVLVIGTGGREHALVLALAADPRCTEVHAAPGNPGMAALATLHDVDPMDGAAVAALARDLGVGLVVVGPEAPLVAGVADAVRGVGIPCFGPTQEAAMLEGSKAFAKEVMTAAGVPTAAAHACATPDEVAAALDEFGPPYVVKDDGLAAGKGVVVTDDRQEALDHAASCERVIVEEYLDGPEVSLFGITDGVTVYPLLPAQDFKRIFDGEQGANTGGMGAYTPLPWAPAGPGRRHHPHRPPADRRRDGTARHALPGPAVRRPRAHLEGPAGGGVQRPVRRPRDPAHPGAPRRPAAAAAARCGHRLASPTYPPPAWKPGAAVTVVMASRGYPETSSQGRRHRRHRDPRPRPVGPGVPCRHGERRRPPRHRRRPGARRHRASATTSPTPGPAPTRASR